MKIEAVRKLALALPEANEEPHFESSSFRIRGKIFATVPPQGGILHVFVTEEQRELALALEPDFLERLHWGKKVVGLRVILEQAKPKVVASLLQQSWERKAPKQLLPKSDPPTASSE